MESKVRVFVVRTTVACLTPAASPTRLVRMIHGFITDHSWSIIIPAADIDRFPACQPLLLEISRIIGSVMPCYAYYHA